MANVHSYYKFPKTQLLITLYGDCDLLKVAMPLPATNIAKLFIALSEMNLLSAQSR